MNTAQPTPGATRPGGRTARTRAAVLAAVFDELGEGGYAALSMERIAQRSGIHLATLYRRWRSVERLLCDLLADMSERVPLPDNGSLLADLRALAATIARFYAEPRHHGLIEAVVSAAAREPQASNALREFFDDRLRLAGRMVVRAVERGEVPAGTDPGDVMAALGAPFYYRMLIARRPVDAELIESAASAAYVSARAGVFVRGTTTGNDEWK
ncbi:TetR/AcrR family transcriptional regulator [Streptomyces sp. MST-110588]|uniref:TetR/AcrR family transcriptional regulator n=1 Tax=Streptomyces sp. MST-110588 TaxID=2833628 RepID=UPI001F5C620E|nr:TetR/AcrR family transcriptional regulator [Streptomyces sp. MST-110588]UNO40865.1 TetR/AcrR family transcriptional regulator [Streptomyces sp. MST-110588]